MSANWVDLLRSNFRCGRMRKNRAGELAGCFALAYDRQM